MRPSVQPENKEEREVEGLEVHVREKPCGYVPARSSFKQGLRFQLFISIGHVFIINRQLELSGFMVFPQETVEARVEVTVWIPSHCLFATAWKDSGVHGGNYSGC